MIYLYDLIFLLVTFLVWPIATIFGWYRWTGAEPDTSIVGVLSLSGHSFATLSLLLAVAAVFVGDTLGGFRFWDPSLLKIYRVGLALSVVGLTLAICGAWKSGPLRWSAPLAALGAMLFWFASAMTE